MYVYNRKLYYESLGIKTAENEETKRQDSVSGDQTLK